MSSYVYMLTCTLNSKMYIGKANDPRSRWRDHQRAALRGVQKRFYDAIRSHGGSSFELSILQECDNDADALLAEKAWIQRLNTLHPSGYNMTVGGEGVAGQIVIDSNRNRKVSHTTRRKMSKRSVIVSSDTRKSLSEKMKGRKFSPLHRLRHKKAAQRRSIKAMNSKKLPSKQLVLFVVGPDGCGKSSIISELSRVLNVPAFKASDEHATFLGTQKKFLSDLRFADPRIEDFLYQTGASVIFDRGYPCEKVYAEFYDRETDHKVLRFLDEKYAAMGAKILVCTRSSFQGRVDNLDARLDQTALAKISNLYQEFLIWTKCSTLMLNVDDENLTRELNDIMKWLDE